LPLRRHGVLRGLLRDRPSLPRDRRRAPAHRRVRAGMVHGEAAHESRAGRPGVRRSRRDDLLRHALGDLQAHAGAARRTTGPLGSGVERTRAAGRGEAGADDWGDRRGDAAFKREQERKMTNEIGTPRVAPASEQPQATTPASSGHWTSTKFAKHVLLDALVKHVLGLMTYGMSDLGEVL